MGPDRPGATVVDPDRLATLEEERAFLLRSLRDLEAERSAGDVDEPAGPFRDAAALLAVLDGLEDGVDEIGITGYPESHAFISDAATIKAMFEKEEFGTYIVSQICFDPGVTAAWVAAVRDRGTRLPIHIGLPGAVPCSKLLRVAERIGVGDSIRLVRDEGDFDPDDLVAGLDASIARPRPNVGGFHIFTFNDLEATERWRQRALRRLQPA